MLTDAMVLDKIESKINDHKQDLERFRNRVDAIRKLENVGLDLVKDRWDISNYQYRVTRDQLPLIRKALGRLTMNGKTAAYDFDKTNEIEVTLSPMDKQFSDLRFVYRVKFRKGGKCRIIRSQSQYENVSLVCDR